MKYTLLLVLCITIASCSEDSIEIFDEKRNVFIGNWDVHIDRKVFKSDTLISSNIEDYKITFSTNGGGDFNKGIFGIERIEWIYQINPERIFLTSQSNFNLLFQNFYLFEIEENTINSQKWIIEKDETDFSDNTIKHISEVWELTKIE